MTQSESRVMMILLLLVVSGWIGKVWIRTHPPQELTPLPVPGSLATR